MTQVSGGAARVEIRADFPEMISPLNRPECIVALIEAELAKAGVTLAEAGMIHIAYPHKHPGLFPGHFNAAAECAGDLAARLRGARPDIKWIKDDGLCEAVHLKRSETQASLYALTGRQV